MIGSVEPQKEVFEPQKGGFQCFFLGGGGESQNVGFEP